MAVPEGTDLVSKNLLTKIDRLRETNVGAIIPLPQANIAMGIRMDTVDNSSEFSAFSQDILKIEINGPDQVHLTVIDMPGIFRVSTPGEYSSFPTKI
ncbi:hypothetical protein H634G_10753 [Metarhizium anisopliae BRIP 53293]|uniref:Dynamin GTPase domain-containing protein n=1 Tax=Metarhizium anisopliae BRIP 53293 TaxID=1291518 RepID=A0A0D9NJ11_METAN|nr:hypothetical protein H634G_10753 [Metarhizium anisopliae BRIP 53293]KJK86074.1 hypothetical protein H633G_10087 [Metarhizium anisopliae BRIP 53284]